MPARDYLYLRTPSDNSGTLQVQLNNINGLPVLIGKLINDGNTPRIDVSNLSSGMYFLRITSGSGSVVKKVVINNK